MKSDEVVDTVWMRLGQEKYLVWEVELALLLAALVSYFTMPFRDIRHSMGTKRLGIASVRLCRI